jgi:hypothetical protein
LNVSANIGNIVNANVYEMVNNEPHSSIVVRKDLVNWSIGEILRYFSVHDYHGNLYREQLEEILDIVAARDVDNCGYITLACLASDPTDVVKFVSGASV